jgi:maltose alpha-D-glucosyltransferase/alpha-amylase
MLHLRKQHPAFGEGTLQLLSPENCSVLAYLRQNVNETLLILNNLSPKAQDISLSLPNAAGSRLYDLIIDKPAENLLPQNHLFHLEGYRFRWLKLEQGTNQPPIIT